MPYVLSLNITEYYEVPFRVSSRKIDIFNYKFWMKILISNVGDSLKPSNENHEGIRCFLINTIQKLII